MTQFRPVDRVQPEDPQFSRDVLDAILSAIAVLDESGVIVDVNSAWNDLGKAGGADPWRIGPGADYLAACDRAAAEGLSDAAEFAAGIRAVARGEREVFELEYACRMPSGERWFLGRVTQFRSGGVVRLVVVHEDVTERVIAQRDLAAKAVELARSNAELDHFTSMASHDLQQPLRAVRGYLEILERRCGADLEKESLELLTGALEGTLQMRKLINDLLAYARVSTVSGQPDAVDCGRVVAQVLVALEGTILESGAEVAVATLPSVRGLRAGIGQLFQNLVGNALKFRGTESPRIHIGSERCADGWLFTVRDNGIGIDPASQGRIFEPFNRLHPQSAYPGSGMGLAICRKVVEKHGGRIWVESEAGKGATFRFVLPSH